MSYSTTYSRPSTAQLDSKTLAVAQLSGVGIVPHPISELRRKLQERMEQKESLKERLAARARQSEERDAADIASAPAPMSLKQKIASRKAAALEEEEFLRTNHGYEEEEEEEEELLYDEFGKVMRQANCTKCHWDRIKYWFRHPYARILVVIGVFLLNIVMYGAGSSRCPMHSKSFLTLPMVSVQIRSRVPVRKLEFPFLVTCGHFVFAPGHPHPGCVW